MGNAYFPINGQDASLSSYKLEEPTYTAGGKVEGTVVLKYDDGSTKASIEVPFSYDIEKLYTADENVVRAKDALEKYFSEYKGATAATTSDDILQIAKNEVESKYGVKVSYAQKYGDTDILLVNDKNAKKITGSLVVSAKGASKTATAAVNIDYTVSDTFRITGLDSATEYTFAVKAFVNDEDGAAHYGPVSDAIKTATDPLATQVTKSSSSKSAVRLYYKESKGADGYKIQKYNTSTKKWETVKITSKTNYKVKGLNSKTSYKFRVQAFKRTSGKKLYSAWSTAYTAKTK